MSAAVLVLVAPGRARCGGGFGSLQTARTEPNPPPPAAPVALAAERWIRLASAPADRAGPTATLITEEHA